MDFNPHLSWTTFEHGIGKAFFVVVKGHRRNRDLMFNRQSKGAVLKFIQNYIKTFGHPALWKDTDAQTFIQAALGPSKSLYPTFGIAAIHQNTCAFVDVAEQRKLCQFFFSHKNKWIFSGIEHQHDICHGSVIGHKHITDSLFVIYLPFNNWITPDTVYNRPGPNSGHLKKEWIPRMFQYTDKEKWKQNNGNCGYYHIKPNAVERSKNILKYFHRFSKVTI